MATMWTMVMRSARMRLTAPPLLADSADAVADAAGAADAAVDEHGHVVGYPNTMLCSSSFRRWRALINQQALTTLSLDGSTGTWRGDAKLAKPRRWICFDLDPVSRVAVDLVDRLG